MPEHDRKIHRIVITGGPCAGKTSVLTYLKQELTEHGLVPIIVPEAARMIIASGVTPADIGAYEFQRLVMRLQRQHEKQFLTAARLLHGHRVVMLCDRGLMDSLAYIDSGSFTQLIENENWNVTQLRDRRYEGVIHLLTAAYGAEQYYVTDSERRETLEDARTLDDATKAAWTGTPHLRVVDNTGDFESKMHRTLQCVLDIVGQPVPLEIERKYLVDRACLERMPKEAVRISIEQAYPGTRGRSYDRIRKREQDGNAMYVRTVKRSVRKGVREEFEHEMPRSKYQRLFASCGKGQILRKDRWCFLYENQYFEFDDFGPSESDLCILEIELTEEGQEPLLPPWVQVIREVTHDDSYGNRELAERFAIV